MEKEGWKIVAIGISIFSLLIIIGITVGWIVSTGSLKAEVSSLEKECDSDIVELRNSSKEDLNKQKKSYEEKMKNLEQQMEDANTLATTKYVNLESKYGNERVKTKEMSNEMVVIRQKLRNINLALRASVQDAHRAIDSNYSNYQNNRWTTTKVL